MSSGAKATSYLIPEVTPGVTPTTGNYKTLRLTGNTLSATTNTQVSDEITDSRVSQGSVATSTDIQGDLNGELSFGGAFDDLLEAAFYGTWTGDVLTIGDTRRTFTLAKNYNDIDVYALFKGMHASTFTLDIPSDGKITYGFTMMGLDYADGTVNTIAAADAPTTTPFMSNINVGDLIIDGTSPEGVACVSAMNISLDNSLQTQRCLGTARLGPGAHIATEAAITGSLTLAWSQRSWQLWKNSFTRAPVALSYVITDSLGNGYIFNFPAIEIDGDLPDGGKRDLVEATLNWTVAKIPPTITRFRAAAVTAVEVTPATATLAVGATQQLAKSITPAEAPQNVGWESSNPAVATVTSGGFVTAVSSGTATITATSAVDATKTDTAAITVTA